MRLSDRRAGTDINSHKANTIKSKAYQALVHSAPNTLTIRDKSDHSRRRRILSLAFSEAKIQLCENILSCHQLTASVKYDETDMVPYPQVTG